MKTLIETILARAFESKEITEPPPATVDIDNFDFLEAKAQQPKTRQHIWGVPYYKKKKGAYLYIGCSLFYNGGYCKSRSSQRRDQAFHYYPNANKKKNARCCLEVRSESTIKKRKIDSLECKTLSGSYRLQKERVVLIIL
jgi:hypothetical protein